MAQPQHEEGRGATPASLVDTQAMEGVGVGRHRVWRAVQVVLDLLQETLEEIR